MILPEEAEISPAVGSYHIRHAPLFGKDISLAGWWEVDSLTICVRLSAYVREEQTNRGRVYV